jgi:LysR family transcriptional regulator, transcriptional activator of nhaA
MEWLNYHHLLYFWTVVREGGMSRAAERLRLAQPTVSAQVRLLEQTLGEKLLERRGRRVVPTEVGRVVYGYADEIFSIGRELLGTLKGRPSGRAPQLTVGVANAVPKLIVHRLLRPAIDAAGPVHLVCREGNPEQLVSALATHALDVIISDAPAPPHVRVRVFNHLLGESGLSFFARGKLVPRLRRRFPKSLMELPWLLPTSNTSLRRGLDQWFEARNLHPQVLAEFEDSALMDAFAEEGGVAFPSPTAIEKQVCRHYRVQVIGRTDAVRERYYAVSAERRIKHPAVAAITAAAQDVLRA